MMAPLLEVGIALTAIALAGALASRIGLSVIPAYIVVGVLVGPNPPTELFGVSLTLVAYGEFVEVVAELGVVFLLFFLGLEFSVGQLLADRERVLTIGAVDAVINGGLGLALGFLFGYSVIETLFLAGIVYISSSAVITKSLIDTGWVANPESRPILGTLVFEDIAIAVYLAVLAAVALGSGTPVEAAIDVGRAFAVLGVLGAVAWYGPSLVTRLFSTDSDELFVLRVIGVTTLIAGVALATGLSEAVAAFFVGMAFSETDLTDRIESVVGPAKDLFAAVFFFVIGVQTDVTLFAGVAGLLAVAVLVTTAGKLASGTLSGQVYGLSRTRSIRVGLGMVPRGEFSLVIAALATTVGTGALAAEIPAFAVGYVLVMSTLGTILIQESAWITDRVGT
ncbi:cation:proton antiporter [Halococcoides cellulosivorans]|uniref:Cation:proton antiporter n=1 Tax=Halococcoides cellulosivorans TaxID=1679096 RepID=A0A2R4X455_9EURY|nr:cation:proton antiporter [Halococcoides cellulosivorans]